MIFVGRNQIPYWYSVYRCKRSGGVHYGVDIVGLDSDAIRTPVAGTVKSAQCVTNHSNKTWEWGWYVRVDDAQGNKHFFCHCAAGSLRVKAGQRVGAGDVLAIMGNTGNAAYANPPIKHVHYEVRTAGDAYLDPCRWAGVPNAVGTYGAQAAGNLQTLYRLHLRSAPGTQYASLGVLPAGTPVGKYLETDGAWARVKLEGVNGADGFAWLCTDFVGVA